MSKLSRKKFFLSGLSLTAIAAFFKGESDQPEQKKTAKFLTQDGKLVEIDLDKLPSTKKTATKEDVQSWIKK